MLINYLCKTIGEKWKFLQFFTSMMPPSCLDTIFWKPLLSRFSFPLDELRNVVTTVLMAASISKKKERDKDKEKKGVWMLEVARRDTAIS